MSRREDIHLYLAAMGETAYLIDPDHFDEAIIGIVDDCGNAVVAYDMHKVIKILAVYEGLDYEDAKERFYFNIQGECMGQNSPIFIDTSCFRDCND